jgi:aminoglycoside phosphotransferase (APT) family kinase protein
VDVRRNIQLAAEWLARLHRSGVGGGRSYTFHRHLHTLAGWKARIAQAYPSVEHSLGDLLRRIEMRGAELPLRAASPTHRDFSPDNLIFDGGRLTVLDFDEFCQYDSLFDVAHFVAHLHLMALTSQAASSYFHGIADLFQATYAALATEYSEPRLALYRAVSCFKLAHIVATVQRPPGWKDVVDCLLLEADQQLQREPK